MCVAGVYCVHGGVHVSWGCPPSNNTARPLVKKGVLIVLLCRHSFRHCLFDMYMIKA